MQNVDSRRFRKALKSNGFREIRQNGDHMIYKRNANEILSVPVCGNKQINGCMVKRLAKEFDIKM